MRTFLVLNCSQSMKIKVIETTCFIPAELATVWTFFSNPANLNAITPPELKFEILSDIENKEMHSGMIIRYNIRPLMNIPMSWTTEITHCHDQQFFVDEQRFGPYAFWHHQHHFKAVEGGVEMTDIVHYAVGWGILGKIASWVYVDRQLQHIFDFRNIEIKKIFPAGK